MFKPRKIGYAFSDTFAEQEKQVTIAMDTFDFQDTSEYRVFYQLEPPEVLDITQSLIDNHKFYDLILAWNEKVLNACPNAVKFLFGTCRWAENPTDDCDVSQKKFEVSYLTSSKTMCAGHMFRHEVLQQDSCKSRATGGDKTHVSRGMPVLAHWSASVRCCTHFQYSIVMENG